MKINQVGFCLLLDGSPLQSIFVFALFQNPKPYRTETVANLQMGQSHSNRSPSALIGHQLRLALYNKERDRVAELLRHTDLRVADLPVEVYVELIQRLWDSATVAALCKGATQDNLRALLHTAVLQGSNAVNYGALFRQLRSASEGHSSSEAAAATPTSVRWAELNLIRLFPIVCHKSNDDMFSSFLEDGSFDPLDTMPLRITVQRELRRNKTCDVSRIRQILRTHERQRGAVEALLSDLVPTGKFEHSKKAVEAVLEEFLSSPSTQFDGPSAQGERNELLLGSPTYRRRLQAVVMALHKNDAVSEKSIREVASFIPKS